jgi:hypothetical protein
MELEEKVKRALERIENSRTPLHPFELFGIEHEYGWYGLTLPIIEEIRRYNEKHPKKKIHIDQIKEKWGRLEIYTTGAPAYLEAMILKAGKESEHICEICGGRGEQVKINGWFWTLCKEHTEAKQKAGNDEDLLNRLYKKLLDIKNYGWKTHSNTEGDKS